MKIPNPKPVYTYIILLCFLSNPSLIAQDILLSFENYGVADGLSHRQVNTIYQDHEGFIWAGTEYGLNRFDGYQFKWWTMEKNGLSQNSIYRITEDAAGYLWVIYGYPHKNREFLHIRNIDLLSPISRAAILFEEKFGSDLPFSLEDLYAIRFLRGSDHSIYFGASRSARLIRYHPKSGFEVIKIIGYQSFLPLCIDTEGSFWGIANEKQLIKISSEGKVLFKQAYKELLHPNQIAFDGRYLWMQIGGPVSPAWFQKIDTQEKTIQNLDWTNFQVPEFQAEHGYSKIRYDPVHQQIWGISPYSHVIPFSSQNPKKDLKLVEQLSIFIKQGLFGGRSFTIDRAGQIWLGGDFGLSKMVQNSNRFQTYLYKAQPSDSRDHFRCRGIVKMDDQLLVSIGNKGLYQVDLNAQKSPILLQATRFNQTKNIGSFGIVKSDQYAYWAVGGNLFQISPHNNQMNIYPRKDSIKETVNWSMHQDKNGRIWIGRANGLLYWNAQEQKMEHFADYNAFEELSNARIVDFVEDQEGWIWLCSNQGLYTLDLEKGVTKRFWTGGKEGEKLPHDDIRHIYQDKEGIYWLATGGAGLIRWNKKENQLQSFTRADGLSNNMLYAVYEDQKQHLWLSSDYGIMQFDKNDFSVQTYLTQDGITNNEFNRTSHFQDKQGRIYFGTINGLTAFDPKDFYDDSKNRETQLVVTDFKQFDGKQNKLLDRKVDLMQSGKIRLQPNDRFFYLSFSLLSYDKTEQISYAYQIEGWQNDWQYQKENTLRFGRLPYGKHLLKIKAQAADGQWSQNELHFPISVQKPYYLQGWFLGLIGLLSILSIIFVYRFNLNRQIDKEKALRLEELNTLKNRFYTNITHEFRTPLTVILGMTELRDNFPKAMDLIQRNGQKLLLLINQLLDLSKIDAGHKKVHYQQIEMVSFTQYLGESFQSLAERKNIRLAVYSEIQELWMDMDENIFQQIISNLLSNAIKFTPESGKIIVHLTKKEDQLYLKVKDNGNGIPKEELSFIFDRFYQVDNAASRQGKGTGIGLALVKELVELIKGEIKVESKVDKGTTFELRFPVRNTTSHRLKKFGAFLKDINIIERKDVSIENKLEERPSLLIIEDNPDVITYIQSLLQDQYNIETATNGALGIQKAIDKTPDIIICDLMMPIKDGYEVLEILKQDERTSHIPIIILTAKATQKDKIRGLKFGADAYLMKPFDKAELLVRLKNLIEVRRQIQEKYADFDFNKINLENREDQFLKKLHAYIEEHYEETELSVVDIATGMQMSHSQFYRKLKALTNKTPSQFLRTIRLKKAKLLLQENQFNISEIAYEVGFSDPNYFIRLFRQEFGESPNSYRKSL